MQAPAPGVKLTGVTTTDTAEPPSGAQAGPAQPPVLDKRRRNVVFVTIMLGMLLAALDQTIVGTALPTIVSDLGGAEHMSWVVTAYLLAETVATVLVGKFGDLFGRKVVFQASAIIFITGSFLCGLASNMTLLIVWRGVQGIGAGGLMVTAMALIADVIRCASAASTRAPSVPSSVSPPSSARCSAASSPTTSPGAGASTSTSPSRSSSSWPRPARSRL